MEDPLEPFWTQYMEAERSGLREPALQALEAFLCAIETCARGFQTSWVESIAQRVSIGDRSAVVRFPLFNRLIGPVLVEGVLEGRPGSARLLSSFDQFLYSETPGLARLPMSLRSVEALLVEALRVSPDDVEARQSLVKHRARYLKYTLHELPMGVLYGHDGASVAECDDLLRFLDDFVVDVRLLGQEGEYAELVSSCRFHYTEYKQYLESPLRGCGYGAYLERGKGA